MKNGICRVPLIEKLRLRKLTFDTFLFNEKKEKAIYDYLCKKKLNRKLLTDEVKFESFHSWEQYIVNRYEAYSKASLIELSKFLNCRLRKYKKCNNWLREIWAACMSGVFALVIAELFTDKFENIIAFFKALAILLIVLIVVIIELSKDKGMEDIYFLEDVKDIIDKMIKEK